MRVISNTCIEDLEYEYLRVIVFDNVNTVTDDKFNPIPIVSNGYYGVKVIVNPLFVKYIIAVYGKETLRINTPICNDNANDFDRVIVPRHNLSNDGTPELIPQEIIVRKRNILTGKKYTCPKWPAGTSLRGSVRRDTYSYYSVQADDTFSSSTIKMTLVDIVCNQAFNWGFYIQASKDDKLSKIEAICYWSDTHLLVCVNTSGYRIKYYLVPSLADIFPNVTTFVLDDNNDNRIIPLIGINNSWKSLEYGTNPMIRHKNKIYHFNKAVVDSQGNPSALRILDINLNTITGSKLGLPPFNPNYREPYFWPTNLISTKYALMAFNGSVARMVDYKIETGTSVKVQMITLENTQNVEIVSNQNFSISKI